jgi:DNA-binding NtrC family response regulator
MATDDKRGDKCGDKSDDKKEPRQKQDPVAVPASTASSTTDRRLKLLVIDDDDLVVSALRMALPAGWRLVHSSDPLHAPKGNFTAALVDMHLTGNLKKAEGVDLIKALNDQDPHLEIVAMSGDLDRDLMEACLRAGASRFLAKPLGPEEFILTLEKIEALVLLRDAAIRPAGRRKSWIGSSQASRTALRSIASLRGEAGPILLEGESGTGKEVAAQLIHEQDGMGRPFVTLNVAALPENVFESEFFGHVRGAFTGADQNKMGLSEAAHGGDLFLDEIEALPSTQQAKLLRFLESGEIRRVGSKDSIRIQTRVIAATNQNLESMVREGKFREDLLWRLNGKKLTLPPLRERREDIKELVHFFLQSERPRRNKSIEQDAIDALASHNWPGNIRELKRVCEQLSLYSPLPIIRSEDVRRILPVTVRESHGGALDLTLGLNVLIANHEAGIVRAALERNSDIDQTAALLQISRSSLYKKIKDYNIEIRS